MNKIQQGATSQPQNRPEPYIEQRVVHTFSGVSIHQEPVEVPEQNEEDSSAFKLKPNLTDLNEIARYIEKFSQLPTDQIMDIYEEAGISISSKAKTSLVSGDRVLSDGQISTEELTLGSMRIPNSDEMEDVYTFKKRTDKYTYHTSTGAVEYDMGMELE